MIVMGIIIQLTFISRMASSQRELTGPNTKKFHMVKTFANTTLLGSTKTRVWKRDTVSLKQEEIKCYKKRSQVIRLRRLIKRIEYNNATKHIEMQLKI
jgi:hypothetical protein